MLALLAVLWLACAPVPAQADLVRVGVLANKGVDTCLAEWSPTVDYLSASLPGHSFVLVPLGFDEIAQAVSRGQVDFLLANSSIYVEAEAAHGISRIATIKIPGVGGAYSLFAGVIFCRADRADIHNFADLKGKRFLAVDPQSFGGWRMAWRELKLARIDPRRDFAELGFTSSHDAVPLAVLAGQADAGTVRSDTLERMERNGRLKMADLRVLNPQPTDRVPFVRSTRLYPEWPLARLKHTPNHLAEAVAVALLSMPLGYPAARAAGYAGWTIPEDYQPVHECLKDLRLGPYAGPGHFSLSDVFDKYWRPLLLSLLAFVCMAVFSALVLRFNRRLKASSEEIKAEMARRQEVEREREALLADLQEALVKVKTLRGMLPICASCKKIRNDEGYWEQVEGYIAKNSEAQFTHGICPECARFLYPNLVDKE
jgi:ABC-type phosphate/phosphonate transport system substrate-binding protein